MNVLIIAILTLTLTGCASTHRRAPVPEVQDVIYRPAAKISSPFTPSRATVSFAWPVKGEVIAAFGDCGDDFRNKGIDIKAPTGEIVRAAAEGKVVYCDSKMRGFGMTVILDHGHSFQTVYSYNSDISVKLGDIVRKGAPIARVGSTGRAKIPSLHFEMRKDGVPVNPITYLERG